MKLAAVETAATSCGKGVIGIKACSNDEKKKISELEAARRSARGGAAMTSAVQEPATATIDEAVASRAAVYRRAMEEMDQRTCSNTMIN